MKKKPNIQFLETIINSDFNIIKQKPTTSISNILDNRLKSNSWKNFDSLNLFILHKTLKQFVRILQFIKRKKKKTITIYAADDQIVEIFEQLSNQLSLQVKIQTETNLYNIKTKKRNYKKLILLLDNNFLKASCINSFIQHNTYLINKFNIKNEKTSFGTYKIFNNLNELNKIAFIFSILHQILGKNVKNK